MESNIGIYLYTNVHTCKVYVGQSVDLHSRHGDFYRFGSHYSGQKIDRARKKYPHPEDWDYKILVYCSEEELDFYETYYIGVYDTIRSGYNCESGGNKNKHIDEESRRRMSEAAKGKRCGKDNPNYGKVMSQEQREKISVTKKKKYKKENHPNYGKTLKEETKSKISISVKANNPKKKITLQYDLNGNLIAEYDSTREAERQLNIAHSSIVKVCNGKWEHIKGFVFKYKKESA